MNRYDARHTFIECIEQYIAGIETDERLTKMCEMVSGYHDPLTSEAAALVGAVLMAAPFKGSYAEGAEAIRVRLASSASQRAA